METFAHELELLLNRHSKENDSNTPDFILAQYLLRCLDAYNTAVKARGKWFKSDEPARSQGEIEEKKFERLIELQDDLHDAEGRPISLAVEMEDEAKLSERVKGCRSEPRCSACGQPEWHKDHHGQIHNADTRNHLFQKANA
jgi:hypothetical protein